MFISIMSLGNYSSCNNTLLVSLSLTDILLLPLRFILFIFLTLKFFVFFFLDRPVERCFKVSDDVIFQIDLSFNIFFLLYFILRVSPASICISSDSFIQLIILQLMYLCTFLLPTPHSHLDCSIFFLGTSIN